MMRRTMIHNATELMDYIQLVGFLPLLDSGIRGYSADEAVDPECRYVLLDDGGWDWPLWQWKGPIVTEGSCVYGKFFNKKAGFVSREWWPDLYNWRHHAHAAPTAGSIEETILMTLREGGSLITCDLRKACGFTGPKMRSRFDGYITRLQMACRIVTEDFVYPSDKHNHPYGWGRALLTTPEDLLGKDACHCDRSPDESLDRMLTHLAHVIPQATERQLTQLIK